jgi:hypothetical protein
MHRITRKQEIEMSKAQTDIRTTSYDANQANAVGYQGTLDDALAQVRAERDFPVTNRARAELLHYLGVDRPIEQMSGIQLHGNPFARDGYFEDHYGYLSVEDDSVQYGKPDEDRICNYCDGSCYAAPSKYSLEFAISQGWVTRVQEV